MPGKEEFKIYFNIKQNIKERISGVKNAFFIEGGGTKGVYAIGILKYLFDNNPHFSLADVNIFGGTSVGSYLATALSLGFQKDDMIEISKIIDISKLIDSKYIDLCQRDICIMMMEDKISLKKFWIIK
jgi:predicted acylesterase/phospholipase RssA